MPNIVSSNPSRAVIAIILSIIPGFGHIYLRQIFKGFVLILSIVLAIIIIWFAISNKDFKLIDLREKQVMFNPAMKTISIFGQHIRVTEIMKVTGTIQLLFTWFYSVFDTLRELRKSKQTAN